MRIFDDYIHKPWIFFSWGSPFKWGKSHLDFWISHLKNPTLVCNHLVDLYLSDLDNSKTNRKLSFSAFDWLLNHQNPINIKGFNDKFCAYPKTQGWENPTLFFYIPPCSKKKVLELSVFARLGNQSGEKCT